MVVDKAMIVAGIGSRKGVTRAEVLAAIDAALEAHGLGRGDLSALATTAFKREEQAIFEAGRELGIAVVVVEGDDVAHSTRTLTDRFGGGGEARTTDRATELLSHSKLSQALAGTPSVSEAAALAAAGEGAKLLGPRTALGPVTCAIAIVGPRP
jgi:cobalt-precorrin 5A hydrolase